MQINQKKKIAIFSMISSCFFFSVLGGFIKYLSEIIHPFEQAFFRNLISVLILMPIAYLYKKKILNTQRKFLLLIRSVFGSLTMIFLFLSYSLIPLSQAVAISFTTPLFIFVGGIIFFNEKPKKVKILALILGFFSILLVIRPDLNIEIGSIVGLLAAIFHAVAGLIVKELSKTEKVITIMFFMVIFMSIFTFFPAISYWKTPSENETWTFLFLIALVGTAGNYFWTKSLSMSEITNVIPFDFSKLIFSSLIGFYFFDETFNISTLIGGIIIVVSNIILAKNV